MGKYRKVDPRIWGDAKFLELSGPPCGKLLFFFLLTHPHMTALGAMRATPAGLAAELNWPEKAFRKAFREAFQKGLIKASEKDCFIWLPNFLKYNRPESPNVLKSWASALDYLPECSLKFELIHHVKAFSEGLSKGFQEAFAEAFSEALAHPYPNQEQEQEQEQEQDNPPKSPQGDNGGAIVPEIIIEKKGPSLFDMFWKVYPKKVAKQKAIPAWEKHVGGNMGIVRQISAALSWQIPSDGWTRENGRFIPDPPKYLNQHRWTDEPPENVGPETRTDEKFYGTLKNLFEFANEDGDSAHD